MTIAENINLMELHKLWLHKKPFTFMKMDFSVLKVDGAIKEIRLMRKGKESVVLQYPQTKLGFCIITDLIDNK